MRPAANVYAAALLDRACQAWNENDLEQVRELADLATGGAQRDDERFLWEALLSCVDAARGIESAAVLRPEDLLRIDSVARAEISHYAALAAYLRRDYHRASWWLARSPSPTLALQARRLLLEADVAAGRDDVATCATSLLAALELLASEGQVQRRILVQAVQRLSLLSSDIPIDTNPGSPSGLPGTDSRLGESCSALRIAGWTKALRGEQPAAFTFFAREELCARTPLERLTAYLDRTTLMLFGNLREPCSAAATVALIEEYVRVIPWADADDLPTLAQAAAILAEFGCVDSALHCCAIVEQAAQALSPRCAAAHGTRLEGFAAEARALALRHRDTGKAAECAARAYAIFARLGFAWRAARMAMVLYQINHAHRWQQRALHHLSCYPPTVFPRFLSSSVLTQREREILDLVRAGHTVADIGDKLDIGESTVRTHVRNLYRKFQATNHAQLLAKSM